MLPAKVPLEGVTRLLEIHVFWKDDGKLLDVAREFAAKATTAPPALARRVKQTLRQMPTVSSPDEAVSVELEAQLWSMQQPDFAERLKARRKK